MRLAMTIHCAFLPNVKRSLSLAPVARQCALMCFVGVPEGRG